VEDDRSDGGEALWAESPAKPSKLVAVFSPRPWDTLGLETIYEGISCITAVHACSPTDPDTALLRHYLYAHGLVRVAASGAWGSLIFELISLCSQTRRRAQRRQLGVATPRCSVPVISREERSG
jgi:hypothetical protein